MLQPPLQCATGRSIQRFLNILTTSRRNLQALHHTLKYVSIVDLMLNSSVLQGIGFAGIYFSSYKGEFGLKSKESGNNFSVMPVFIFN